MSDLFWLTDAQMERLKPFFLLLHRVPLVDDERVLSEIILINHNGLHWWDAPVEYGSPKTLYNRWVRWGRLGVSARMLTELASKGQNTEAVMIDVEKLVRHRSENLFRGHLKAHRTACGVKRGGGRQDRALHRAHQRRHEFQTARRECRERPTDQPVSKRGPDQRLHRAAALLSTLPKAGAALADRGYGTDFFHTALITHDIQPFIQSQKKPQSRHPA